MKAILLSLAGIGLVALPAAAQDLSASPQNGQPVHVSGGSGIFNPAQTCFYGGDPDFRNALTSERNTAVSDAMTYDDVDWPGGQVTEVWGHFNSLITNVTSGDIIIYQGMSAGVFGTLIHEEQDVSATWTQIPGWDQWGRPAWELSLDVTPFNLDPGTYHVGIRPVGGGSQQAWVYSTSGSNSEGGPIANGNVFLVSPHFGYFTPTDWRDLLGQQNWDVSYGLCGGGAPGLQIALSGSCPGPMTLRWTGASAGRPAGVAIASGTGAFVIPGGPCAGTQLGLNSTASLLTPPGQFSTGPNGEGSFSGNAGGGACGRFLQMVVFQSGAPPCDTSNVVQIQ